MNFPAGIQALSTPAVIQNRGVSLWKLEPLAIRFTETECLDCLSADERERAIRFNLSVDRQRFIFVRFLLRHLLAEILACRPDQLKFESGSTGRPEIVWPDVQLRFNISHSNSFTLVALSEYSPVGIDVEGIDRNIKLISVGETVFCAEEMSFLNTLKGNDQTRLFFRLWTAKEALLKMLATGFSLEPRSFSLLGALENDEVVKMPVLREGFPECMQLVELDIGDNYNASLVIGMER